MPERVSAVRAAPPRMGWTGRALRAIGERTSVCFRVVFADGTSFQNRDGPPEATLTFRNAAAERRVWLFGHVGLIESYIDRWLDVDGDFAAAFRAGMDARFDWRSNPLNTIRNHWHEFRFGNGSLAQAKANAEFHYALGTEFYRYWLDDPYMMYTCAYWQDGTTTLEQAQQNKMEHVCRKVQLKPGETFVDVGCGWGGFTFYAWERYKAIGTGINATGEQVAAMRREIARRGLDDTLKVIEADFREIPGTYDKVVSIGTLEHAGRDQIPAVVRAHAKCLKPGGIGMLHFIGHLGNHDTEFYIRKHIFPGGWIPGLAETVSAMEKAGLEVLDIENLRRHYAHTLDAWVERFERHWPDIHALDPAAFDERFRRRWRAYLYSCAEMFRSPNGHTHLFQITYCRGNVRNYPMSRAHIYT